MLSPSQSVSPQEAEEAESYLVIHRKPSWKQYLLFLSKALLVLGLIVLALDPGLTNTSVYISALTRTPLGLMLQQLWHGSLSLVKSFW